MICKVQVNKELSGDDRIQYLHQRWLDKCIETNAKDTNNICNDVGNTIKITKATSDVLIKRKVS